MIRKAKRTDLNQIMEVVRRSKEKMIALGNPQWGEDYPLRSHFETDIGNEELYVYETNEKIVGVACLSTDGHSEYEEIPWTYEEPYLCMKRLAVDPAYQGRKIGLAFFEYTEELGRAKGIHYICADTNSINKSAQYLFKKADYQFVIQQEHDGQQYPFVYYEKKFS